MSRKVLESQLVEAQRELELSTFLNKGVLQSNSEFKLRIAELEQENSILRAAESRLAKTEDKVELAERRLKELQKDCKAKEGEWAAVLRAEQEAREGMEREVEELREEVRGWREVGERVGGLMARSSSRRGDAARPTGRVGGPGKIPASQGRRGTPADATPAARPRSSAIKLDSSAVPHQPVASPSILPQSGRIQKKRRRIAESADESEEGEEGDEYAPSSPAPARTPRTAVAAPATRANSSATKRRDGPAGPAPQHKRPDPRKTPPPRPITTVKVEQSSPAATSELESDDDPLYLE